MCPTFSNCYLFHIGGHISLDPVILLLQDRPEMYLVNPNKLYLVP